MCRAPRFSGLIVTFCLLAPTGASAAILWRGDFETGDIKQFNHGGINTKSVSVVTSPVREGKYAAKFTVKPTDVFNNDVRVVLQFLKPNPTLNGDVYYAWSVMSSAEQPFVRGSHQIAYWESTAYIPKMYFGLSAESVSFVPYIKVSNAKFSGNIAPGKWHDFVFHVKWSPDPTVGFIELWYDGKKVFDKAYAQTMRSDKEINFTALGMLRDKAIAATEVFYLDAAMVATELADVQLGAAVDVPAKDGGGSDVGPARDAGASDGDSVLDTQGSDDASAADALVTDGGAPLRPEAGGDRVASAAAPGADEKPADGSRQVQGGMGCAIGSTRKTVGGLAVALLGWLVPLFRRGWRRAAPRR